MSEKVRLWLQSIWAETLCPACGCQRKPKEAWLCSLCIDIIRNTEEATTVNRLCAQHLAAVEKMINLAGKRATAGVG